MVESNNMLLLKGNSDANAMLAVPPPPYHAAVDEFLVVGCTYEEEAVHAALPSDLHAAYPFRGYYLAYSARSGWGITPFSAFIIAVEVAGHDSPDGSPGHAIAYGLYSNKAGSAFSDYSSSVRSGSCELVRKDRRVTAKAVGGLGEHLLTLEALEKGLPAPRSSGLHHYLGPDPATGNANIWSVPFSAAWRDASVLSWEIGPDAPETIHQFRPREVLWASSGPGTTLTFGPPRPITDTEQVVSDGAALAILDVFGRLRRPAIIVTPDLRVMQANPWAEQLFGDGIRIANGTLEASARSSEEDLKTLVRTTSAALRTDLPLPAIALTRPTGAKPLLVLALPMANQGTPLVLLVLVDPEQGVGQGALPLLQLLGLTPAEARLTAEVAAGGGIRNAAVSLSITENTARSTLKVVYDKLGVGRQSELARMVTMLQLIE